MLKPSPSSSRPSVLALAVAMLVAASGAPALAQIALPPKSEKPRGNVAPFRVCSICGERNYTISSQARVGADGNPIAYCATCGKDTPHKASTPEPGLTPPPRGAKEEAKLRLPPSAPKKDDAKKDDVKTDAPAPASSATTPEQAPAPQAAKPATSAPGGLAATPAAFVFEEVGKARGLDDSVVTQAIETVAGLGEDGRAQARAELASTSPQRLYVAARVLLRSPAPQDLDLVLARSKDKLPASVCAPIAQALAAADPVRASPRYFAELLEHPTPAMRSAAERVLRDQRGPELVPVLAERLASKRPETRLAALGLLADVDDPAVADLAFQHVADPKSSVAQAALRILASKPGADVDVRLLSMAFNPRWVLRQSAYALLAIVEREDRSLHPILDERHVDKLLDGLKSSDVFVAGSCATALAGIGYRSAHVQQTAWLDQEVVDRLVQAVSGRVFHDDLAALAPSALARLQLLTGQELGSDGARWVEWWIASRAGHVARRAWIEAGPGDEVTLTVRWTENGKTSYLLGPSAKTIAAPGETAAYLDESAARALLGVFREQGLLGPDRPPGTRGARGAGERTLEIAVAGRGKTFLEGADAKDPWFERCADAVASLRERNAWQRFAPAGRSQLAFWQEQLPWWSEEHTSHERALRTKALVLRFLEGRKPEDRDAGVEELVRVLADPQACEPADFDVLLGFVRDEPAYGERAHRLARLALRAAQGGTGAPLEPERARRVLATLVERFPEQAQDDLGAVMAACEPSFARSMSADVRPALRAATAAVLARSADPADSKALLKLLEDSDPRVEVAAIRAIGASKLEAGRTELLVRARLGLPQVRVAALLAVGQLGGEYALDALLLGASDPDPDVRTAAAKGLASLADPSSATMLVSMLSEGPQSVVFEPARAGLAKLGEKALPELLRAVHKTNHPARREAALILSEAGRPEPVTAMMQILSTHPDDARVAGELAVLTCVDFRKDPDPASRWWTWYEGVVHDDALAWFRAALERAGETAPELQSADAWKEHGTRAVRLLLASVVARPEAHLAERARRELARMLDRDLGELPARGPRREAWLTDLRESILASKDP